MGNGQCPECLGAHEGWHGHPCYMEEDSIGHGKDCSLAKAIKELGGDVLYRGEYKSDKQFEYYIDNNGIFGTRLKTENGCEKYNKYEKEFSDRFFSINFNRKRNENKNERKLGFCNDAVCMSVVYHSRLCTRNEKS